MSEIHGPRLRLVKSDGASPGRAPTGEELFCEAAEIAAGYLRLHLSRLPDQDPLRAEVERFAEYGRPLLSHGPGA